MFSGGTQAVISRNLPFSIQNKSLVPLLEWYKKSPNVSGILMISWEEGVNGIGGDGKPKV
jgi:hypothetical protein